MMLKLVIGLLFVSALYCGAMWLLLCIRMWTRREDHETITFRLGLCFVLSIGFLGLIIR
jgi:hypothetical protein